MTVAELVYDAQSLTPGESVFVLHVGQALPAKTILASLTMDLTVPLDEAALRPLHFTGFEQRAGDLLQLAKQRGAERGIKRIVVVDPYGMLPLASPGRYGRR